jgi:hypothetical protein
MATIYDDQKKGTSDKSGSGSVFDNPTGGDRPSYSGWGGGKSPSSSSAANQQELEQDEKRPPTRAGDTAGNSSGGGSTSGTGDTPGYLKNREGSPDEDDGQGNLYNAAPNSSSTRPGRVRLRISRRQAAGGGAAGVIVAVIFGAGSILQGPLQLVHVGEILKKAWPGSDEASSNRTKGLFRYARSGEYGETRVGKLGSLTFADTTKKLKAIGIDFQTGSGSTVKSATINTAKLEKAFPELKNMSIAERRAFLAKKFELSERLLVKINGSNLAGETYAVNTRDFNVKAVRALTDKSVEAIGNGRLQTAIRSRVLAKFHGINGLWHPIQKKVAQAKKDYFTRKDRKAAEERRTKARAPPSNGKLAAAKQKLKDKVSGNEGKLSGALLFTAGMCLVRSVADEVVTVNREAIVVPAALESADKLAVASQVQSGRDISMYQAGAVSESFTDENGKSIFQGKAFKALTDPNTQAGEDIPSEYKQAFSNDTTAAKMNASIGGGSVGGLVCSPIGQVVQISASVLLIFSGPATGGASWGAIATKYGASTAATLGVISLLQSQLVNILKNDTPFPTPLSGPLGGSLLAYGAREMGNTSNRASGGVELSSAESAMLEKKQQLADQQEFRSKSLFAQMFDLHDYRTPVSRFADSLSPNPAKNVGSMLSGLTNISGTLSRVFSSLWPQAHAANEPYDWGFPQYGIPTELLNDSGLEDPYDNADKVSALLNSGDQKYIEKAKSCFGVDINKGTDGWDATAAEEVNPNEQSYTDAHCNDLSDPNWKRVILFVFDTRTMETIDCYMGGTTTSDESCSKAGFDTPVDTASSSATSSGSMPSGSAKELASQLLPYIKDGKIACNFQGANCPDIQGTAAGNSIKNGSCNVDALAPNLVGLLLHLVQQGHTFVLSAICSDHPSNPGSQHHKGEAADFNFIDGVFIGPSGTAPWDAQKLKVASKLDQDAAAVLPKSSQFGQKQCGAGTFTFLSGFNLINDGCHHQHIGVGK